MMLLCFKQRIYFIQFLGKCNVLMETNRPQTQINLPQKWYEIQFLVFVQNATIPIMLLNDTQN